MKYITPEIAECIRLRKYPTPLQAWHGYPKTEQETAFVCDEMMACGIPAMVLLAAGEESMAMDVFIKLFTLEMQSIQSAPVRWYATLGDDAGFRENFFREAKNLELMESSEHEGFPFSN